MTVYSPTAVELGSGITVPASGAPVLAADVIVPVAALADGVKFAQARSDVLADLTALAAILVPTDGLVRHVLGFGMYVFKTSATTGLNPFRVAASDATPGGWVAGAAYETTRSVLASCDHIRGISADGAGAIATINPTSVSQVFGPVGIADGLVQAGGFYPLRIFTGATNHYAWLLPLQEFMIHGSTLSNATLLYRPAAGHAGLPSRFPKLGIARSPLTPSYPTPVSLISSGGGFATDTAASTVAYQVDRSLVFTPDQNNVIDKLTYQYFAVIVDEAGTNALAGTAFHAVQLDFITIPDARRS